MKINLHSRWHITLATPLVAPSVEDAKARQTKLRKRVAEMKLKSAAIRESIKSETKVLEELETSIRQINESDEILAATFGTSTAVISTRTLLGLIAENGPISHFRNQVLSYISRAKGLQARGFPSNDEMGIVLAAFNAMQSNPVFHQRDPKSWLKTVAVQRARVQALQSELHDVEQGGMAENVRQSQAVTPGQDPTMLYRDAQVKVQRSESEINKLVKTGNELVKELQRARTREELESQGVNPADLERDVKQIKRDLDLLETARAQAEASTQRLDKLTNGYRKKHEAALAKKLHEVTVDFDSEPDLEERLQEVRDAFASVWEARMHKLGLQGVTDRSADVAEITTKIETLRAALGVALHRVEALGIRLGDKTVQQYQRELELRVADTSKLIQTRKEAVHPAQQELAELQTPDTWRDAVTTVMRGAAGKKFPAIQRNAIEALKSTHTGILGNVDDPFLGSGITHAFPDAERDIRELLNELFAVAEKKLLAANDFRVDIAVSELLASNNIEPKPGQVTTRDICVKLMKAVIDEINDSQRCETRVRKILGSRELTHTPIKSRGAVLDTTSPKALARRASLIMRKLTDPSAALASKLRPVLNLLVLSYREQVAAWVQRNVRVEAQ